MGSENSDLGTYDECLRVYVLIRTPRCTLTLPKVILTRPWSLIEDGSLRAASFVPMLFKPSVSSSEVDKVSMQVGDVVSFIGLQDLELRIDHGDIIGDFERLQDVV